MGVRNRILTALLFLLAFVPSRTAQSGDVHIRDVEIDATLRSLVALPSFDRSDTRMITLPIRLTVSEGIPDALILTVDGASPDTLVVAYVDDLGNPRREISGRRVALHQRSVPIGGTIVKLPAVRGRTVELTITTRANAMRGLIVRSLAMHERWTSTRHLVISMLYGLLLFATVMTMVFFAAFRDASYAWYIAFLLCYLLTLVTDDTRWIVNTVFAQLPFFRAVSTVIPVVTLAAALQFSRHFLGVRTWSRTLDRCYLACLVLIGAVIILQSIPIPLVQTMAQYAMYGVFIASAVLLLTAGIMALRTGNRTAIYYLGAWTAIALAGIGQTIVQLAEVDTSSSALLRALFGSSMIVHVGAGIEVFMLTLGVAARLRSQRRSDELLRAILPSAIVDRMRTQTHIADDLPAVSVVFCDIVGFTSMAKEVDAETLVRRLDVVFGIMDRAARHHGIEKIKTIGDAYMAVAGAPEPVADHADRAVRFSLDVIDQIGRDDSLGGIRVRVGIHTGPVVAGVLGTWKFGYDVWGQTVNIASRLEQRAEPNGVLLSDDVVRACMHPWPTRPLGLIELRGVGRIDCHAIELGRPA